MVELWAAKGTGWAFWAACQACGTRRAGPGQGPAHGEGRVRPPAVGTQPWECEWPAKGRDGARLGGCGGAACAAGAWLVARSYLAGVDAALRIAGTDVVGVDGPPVPAAAVTDPGINEVDLGLLQRVCRSSSCEEHRKE